METANISAPTKRGPHRIRTASTRTALIAAARARFGEEGFHSTAAAEIVALASVTRGALYHHFGGKEGLFEAVFLAVHRELLDVVVDRVKPYSGDTWRQLVVAIAAHLEVRVKDSRSRRILQVDGPVVLGWARWLELQEEGFRSLTTTFGMLMNEGVIERRSPEILAHLIKAALNDAALMIAHSEDPQSALGPVTDAVLAFVEGLRKGPGQASPS